MIYTTEPEIVRVRDFELNVYHQTVVGSSGTIVFLHDSLGCIALWRGFPGLLCNELQADVLVYDRRGYGASAPFAGVARKNNYLETEADILMELLGLYNIQNPILFGHSNGGTIALYAAAKYADRIKAVITEGAHVFVEDITMEGILRVKDQYRDTDLRQRLEKYHGNKTQALFAAWTETWLAPQFRDWHMRDWLVNIKCPVLVIQGAEDEFGSADQVSTITDSVTGPSETCIVAKAGHSPHKQHANWLISQCSIFLVKNELIYM